MLKDVQIKCPHCGQSTIVAVASPEPGTRFQRKGSITSCRSCRQTILTFTEQDGTVQVLTEPTAEDPDSGSANDVRELEEESRPETSGKILSSPPRLPEPAPLVPPGADDVPDEERVVSLSEVLRRRDGTRRTHKEAVKLFGLRGTWVAELNEALEAHLRGPKPLSIPPRIFVSYRWSTHEQDSWVEKLVRALRDRGYFVVFDRTDCKPGMAVPDFVSSLANCQTFLAVLDPGYASRIGTEGAKMEDGWVFDEYNSAAHLANAGHLTMIGFLRSGNILPRGFKFPVPGRAGNAVDVRNPAKLGSVLDQLFPRIANLPPMEQIDTMSGLIQASHSAVSSGRLEEAWNLAQQATQTIPQIPDGYAQQARIAINAGNSAVGLDAAARALALNPGLPEMLALAGGCAYHEKQFARSIEFCVKLLELQGLPSVERYLHLAHYHLGNALDDSGQSYAGIAHLEIARRLAPGIASFHNDTGLAYRHVGGLLRALSCFDDGLKIAPDDSMLLVNRAAAAVEAGNVGLFNVALQDLARHDPIHPSIDYLTKAVKAWQQAGGPPPQLVPQMRKESIAGTARCTHCPAEIPLAGPKDMLCAGCGGERAAPTGKCPLCQSNGLVVPSLGFLCPYCRDGHLEFSRSANNPAASS